MLFCKTKLRLERSIVNCIKGKLKKMKATLAFLTVVCYPGRLLLLLRLCVVTVQYFKIFKKTFQSKQLCSINDEWFISVNSKASSSILHSFQVEFKLLISRLREMPQNKFKCCHRCRKVENNELCDSDFVSQSKIIKEKDKNRCILFAYQLNYGSFFSQCRFAQFQAIVRSLSIRIILCKADNKYGKSTTAQSVISFVI